MVNKDAEMNVFEILDNVKEYANESFKIGFVGNGEPFLDWEKLKSYIDYIADNQNISVYTITNGTISLPDREWDYLNSHKVNVGFSLDGYRELHNAFRCGSFDRVIQNVETYKSVVGHYPTFNATVGMESINNIDRVIDFFVPYDTRVTFSRMIGKWGISLEEYQDFLDKAEKKLEIRRGSYDCTMYGGFCGAGINNFFFSNGYVYYCGNCVDLPPLGKSSMKFPLLENHSIDFDRSVCFKESICE